MDREPMPRTADSPEGGKPPNAARADKEFKLIIDQLGRSIRRERTTAALIGAVGVVLFAGVFVALRGSTADGVGTIHAAALSQNGSEVVATTIFVLVRGAAFAALLATAVYWVFGLARSALDQATRFDKRLIAAHFIDYSVHAEQIDAEKMEVALRVLYAWGASVESAYTPSKIAVQRSERLNLSAGRNGIGLQHQSDSPQ